MSSINMHKTLFGKIYKKHTLLVEQHSIGCKCSFCRRPMFPFLWIPESRSCHSWTTMVMPWFNSRIYVRMTGLCKRDDRLVNKYIEAGNEFGDAVSYLPSMGKCVGFNKLCRKWQNLEVKYAALGYRTIELNDFVKHGGYGVDISNKIKVRRDVDEEPIFHGGTHFSR